MRQYIPALWALLLGAGCSEYDIKGTEEEPEEPIGDTAPPPTDSEPPPDTGPPPVEECNGVDDDLDGEVDEGFPDIDADGIADCVDEECGTDLIPSAFKPDELCVGGASGMPKDPWNSVIEWRWTDGDVQSTPSIGDLDGDGVPEVVFTSNGNGYVADGASGAIELILPGLDDQSGISLGDIDGDGDADLVGSTGSCFSDHTVVAYDRDGSTLWTRDIGPACETYPYLADLEGDGDVEILVNQYVLDGATGAVVATLSGAGANNWGAPVAADMDGDGTMEILLEHRVYDTSGALLWSCGVNAGTGTFPQPVNADGDAEGELLVAAPGALTLCDEGGAQLWSRPLSGPYGAPVSVADFDGDGEQEFAIPDYGSLRLIDTDGSDLWSAPIQDFSGLAGCTSWDIDADGVSEVVYADEVDFIVFDGATGSRVLVESTHSSVTLAETPAVADVDGDGHGELIYGSNGGSGGLTVVGSALDEWPYAPPVYNQYGYYGDNIRTDLQVPAGAPAPWLAPANIFRGQPSPIYFEDGVNLAGGLLDVCAASCEEGGYAELGFEVYNDGQDTIAAGTEVLIYALDGGDGSPLYAWALPRDLEPGDQEIHSFSTTVDQLAPELMLVLDDAEVIDECDEEDNIQILDGIPCW